MAHALLRLAPPRACVMDDIRTTNVTAKTHAPSPVGISALVFALLTGVVLAIGWSVRNEGYLSPEFGAGYALGIIGGSMMLVLLLHTARKNLRFMRSLGRVKPWFQMHQVLGVVGPVCVLFHANFQFGSTNSSIALACMLAIVASGFVGRFLCGKIRFGLRGRLLALEDLKRLAEAGTDEPAGAFALGSRARARLQVFEDRTVARPDGIIDAFGRILLLPIQLRWTYIRAVREVELEFVARLTNDPVHQQLARVHLSTTSTLIWAYVSAVRNIAHFNLYERLFAGWHVLHIPLFFMLLGSTIVHVIAVHVY